MDARGEEVSFELVSADASTAALVVIYSNGGGNVPRPVRALGAKERLVVTDVIFASAVALTGDLYDGTGASPAAGERIFPIVSTTSVGSMYPSLQTPHYCQVGNTPKVKMAAAGQFSLIGKGFILKA